MTPILDRLRAKLASRKLLAFLTATGALAFGALTGAEWSDITIAYVGTQGFVDVAERIIRARGGDS